jgi:hypothetical protein
MMVAWTELVLFMLGVGSAALHGLAASGHFPADVRATEMTRGAGMTILWGTIVLTAFAAVATVSIGVRVLPWYAVVIGAGAMLLFAPLLLRIFPDRFVDGSGALLTFSVGAASSAVILWLVA